MAASKQEMLDEMWSLEIEKKAIQEDLDALRDRQWHAIGRYNDLKEKVQPAKEKEYEKEHYLFWQFFIGEYLAAMGDTGEVDPCDIKELLEDIKHFYVTTLRHDEPRIIRLRCAAMQREKEMECEHVFITEECGCCMICTECHKLQAVIPGESNHEEEE